MNRRQFVLAGVAAGSLAGCSTPGLKLDVPYVSTPAPVVEGILRLAAVRLDGVEKRVRFTVATMDYTAYLWVVPPR